MIDKEKYLTIARTRGAAAALSELHRDYGKLEHESFEGEAGYQPEKWQSLTELRDFSRELFEMGINPKLARPESAST